METATKNGNILLPKTQRGAKPWVTQNTAIIIIHGIGNQLPLETLDQFGRGLIAEYEGEPGSVKIQHVLMPKPGNAGTWFDNVVRITKDGDENYIDVYEYYWAYYTQDKASTKDIQKWVHNVASGADKFYKTNQELGKEYGDKSIFFDKKGHLNLTLYRLVLWGLTVLIPGLLWILKLLLKAVAYIPLIGTFAKDVLQDIEDSMLMGFNNVVGDIVVYNVTDPKSKFYNVKRQILDGAVDAVRYLIEKTEDTTNGKEPENLAYPGVIVAGHSLGTQIGYDAINKLNLLVNQGEIKNYTAKGLCKLGNVVGRNINNQLTGFITFGSPLDKIAFFLREMVPDALWLRQQILDSYHGFKQQNWSQLGDTDRYPKSYLPLQNSLIRLFDDIQWKNYYDAHDPVSGALDYYKNLTNIDCKFKGKLGGSFTHSSYWLCDDFYRDIIASYLVPESAKLIE